MDGASSQVGDYETESIICLNQSCLFRGVCCIQFVGYWDEENYSRRGIPASHAGNIASWGESRLGLLHGGLWNCAGLEMSLRHGNMRMVKLIVESFCACWGISYKGLFESPA